MTIFASSAVPLENRNVSDISDISDMADTADIPNLSDTSSWGQTGTLFIHVPKTGGTTLDSIFRDHYFDTSLLPSTSFELFGKHIAHLNDPSFRYIGGHYPLAIIDAARFDKRVTVLRDPLDSICSGISYVNKLKGVPPETLIEAERIGLPALTYKKFFSPHFDTERYLLDLSYSAAKSMRKYLFDCMENDAIENIRKFTHVFDFEHFEGEIKRFLIEQEYFPYAEIGRKRQYSYQPDYARARPLVSEFDEKFYQLSTPLFKKVPENINSLYEQYREDYCKNRGLALRIHEGRCLDLRMPLGSGWHHVEQSEKNTSFRWSEEKTATIEIPIATAGLYAVYLYINPAEVNNLQLSISTVLHRCEFKAVLVNENNILIYQVFVFTSAHDWINIVFDMQKNDNSVSSSEQRDTRERGIILGNVYICRHPV